MSQSVNPGCGEQIKNIIHHLYIVKGHQLQGPNGVIKFMEDHHGFKATKAQYERFFTEWGLNKKRKKDDYKVIGQKVESRKKRGRESDVYLDGELIPRKKIQKEISRQGYMTVAEQISQAHVTTPQTPPGFQILTPSAEPLFRLIFNNLPILRFREKAQYFGESIKAFDPGLTSLGPLLGSSQVKVNPGPILSFIDAVLPNPALLDEVTASGLAIERVDKLSADEFLNLTTFLISNNLPGEANGKNIYKWIKDHGSTRVLGALSTMAGPTAKSLLENLFRLAVEAGDTPTAKYLLQAGVNPNGHNCRHIRFPDTLDPLQFACITGNSELAQELIKAGSGIEDGSGWKGSLLVLAIVGHFWEERSGSELVEAQEDSDSELVEAQEDSDSKSEDGSQDEGDSLINLVNTLIDAGASINLRDINTYNETTTSGDEDGYVEAVDPENLPTAFQDGHTPLTAASKYRHKDLVDLLLRKGASIDFPNSRGTRPLQECLYSWEDMMLDVENQGFPSPYRASLSSTSLSSQDSSNITVTRSLLAAGADPNCCFFYEFTPEDDGYDDFHCCDMSAIDLAVLSGAFEVVEMLLLAGANATEECIRFSIEGRNFAIFQLLMGSETPVSRQIVQAAIDADSTTPGSDPWVNLILERRPDSQTKRIAIVEGIRVGDISLLDNELISGTSNLGEFFQDSEELKELIDDCCYHGYFETLRRLFDDMSIPPSVLRDALFHAVSGHRNSYVELVDLLLSTGADVNTTPSDCYPPLLEAIRKRDKAIVEKLLSAGAAVNAKVDCSHYRDKPHKPTGAVLVDAFRWGDVTVIENIIRAGADINAPGPGRYDIANDKCGCKTPLTVAILKRNWTLIKYLVNAGASVHNPPELPPGRTTPLAAAVSLNDIEMVQFLLKAGADPEDELALAEATGDIRILRFLLSVLDSRPGIQEDSNLGRLAIKKAIKKGHVATIELILASKLVDINSVHKNSTVLIQALRKNSSFRPEIVRIILGLGADPNGIVSELNIDGSSVTKSALLVAIQWAGSQNVELLLQVGAEPDRSLIPGMSLTALQYAVRYSENKDIVRMLLDHGADPNATSPYGTKGTPIQIAADRKNTELVRILLDYKADPNAITINAPHTALQIAAGKGGKEMVELLIEYGATVNSPPAEDSGATALQIAAIGGFLGIAYLLLENHADVNAAPAAINGRTALEGAAEHGRIDMVQLFLNAGAKVNGDGQEQYEYALRFASRNGHHATRQLLESYHG